MLRSCSSRLLSRGALASPSLFSPSRAKQSPISVSSNVLTRHFAQVVTPPAKEPTELDNVTTLPNGVRVASEAILGPFSGVGVYIDAGSRYETDFISGASHIMDRLAFKSTQTRSADDMLEELESLGGNIQCASSRESMMYQAATFNSAIPTAVGLLADTIRNPRITDEELEMQLDTARYEVKELWQKPDLILPELIHTAAYKGNTLGNPLLCPEDRISSISRDVIDVYRDAFYRPERLVVAFAGVSHVDAVKLTEQFFGDMKGAPLVADASEASAEGASASSASYSPPPSQQPSRLLSKIPFLKNLSTSAAQSAAVLSSPAWRVGHAHTLSTDRTPAHYTGGFLSLPPMPPPINPNMPSFTHIQLAFEGLPITSDDIYALAALQTLLGGGGSFSAGGPGKGMYSRLYTNVLNQAGWVESCMAFNHSYTDSGLFGIAASCYPGRTNMMLDTMCRELHALTLPSGRSGSLQQAEVDRAKNQLRSSLLMNLESRMIGLEDLGRHIQVHGRKIPVKEMTRRISELTVEDLRRVAHNVVHGLVENPGKGSGAPTVVLQEVNPGSIVSSKEMTWDQIQDQISRWKLGRQ